MTDAADIKWAILDRDGTINKKAPEGAYISDPRDVRLLPGAGPAIGCLNRALQAVVVVTNQRGVALGLMTEGDVALVNTHLNTLLGFAGAHIDRFFVCPHGYGDCDCRKPAPGLLIAASHHVGLPLDQAVVIGDTEADVVAGNAVDAFTIRLAPRRVASQARYVVRELSRAVHMLSATGAG